MSTAMVAALSWPTIVLLVLIFQSLVIWRLRVRVRELTEYEYFYFSQYQPLEQPQPSVSARPGRQPLRRSR